MLRIKFPEHYPVMSVQASVDRIAERSGLAYYSTTVLNDIKAALMMMVPKVGNKVKFVKTSDPRLDDVTGIVIGYYGKNSNMNCSIVLFDVQPEDYDPAIVITNACLEVI